jgi:hypothetical protein
MNRSIVSSLIPSINDELSNEYVSNRTLSFLNGQYHDIFLKAKKKEEVTAQLTLPFLLHETDYYTCRKIVFSHTMMTHPLWVSLHIIFAFNVNEILFFFSTPIISFFFKINLKYTHKKRIFLIVNVEQRDANHVLYFGFFLYINSQM